MFLKELKIRNFRNYEDLEISFSNNINIIFGNNAQGKTNILESIYFLGLTKSHRTLSDIDLISHKKISTVVEGKISRENIDSLYKIVIEDNKKTIICDGNKITKKSEYISKVNIVIFYPEDLELIKGSPNERRQFLNLELSQLSNNYYCILSSYNKILKMRNDLLKKKFREVIFDSTYFEIITQMLIEKAIYIYKARNKFILKINEISHDIYKDIIDIADFNLKYDNNFNFDNYDTDYIKKIMTEKYKDNFDNEVRYGSTLFGPHKDDFGFFIGTNDLKKYGSQGQQRTAVLAVKLGEIELFQNQHNTSPILLLDDVFSELDNDKINNLLKYIDNNIQVVITTTDIKKIKKEIIQKSKIFEIVEGKVIER